MDREEQKAAEKRRRRQARRKRRVKNAKNSEKYIEKGAEGVKNGRKSAGRGMLLISAPRSC